MRTNLTNPLQTLRSRRLVLACMLIALLPPLAAGCRQSSITPRHSTSAFSDLEEGAEDVFDLAVAGNWKRAAMRTNLLRETTARLETAEGRQLPELETAIANLDRAIGAHDARGSARSANAVMREAVYLASPDLGSDRVAILLLDVEAREILVEADADPPAADAAVVRIEKLWRGLRPEVEKRGGHDLAALCDGHLTTLEKGDASARRTEAEALLETIDRLEELLS